VSLRQSTHQWPEIRYVENEFVAILSGDPLDYSVFDWRQRAFIRAAARRILAKLDEVARE
jgi:hypothetical protein